VKSLTDLLAALPLKTGSVKNRSWSNWTEDPACECVKHVLYDTIPITEKTFFQYSLGQVSPSKALKTLKETSYFGLNKMLPSPQIFRVERVTLALIRKEKLLPISNPLWSRLFFKFVVGRTGRSYAEGPAWNFVHPVVLLAGGKLPSENEDEALKRISKALQTTSIDVVIGHSQEFSATVDWWKAPPEDLLIYCGLQGILARSAYN
jgi:hypothetical protein